MIAICCLATVYETIKIIFSNTASLTDQKSVNGETTPLLGSKSTGPVASQPQGEAQSPVVM